MWFMLPKSVGSAHEVREASLLLAQLSSFNMFPELANML